MKTVGYFLFFLVFVTVCGVLLLCTAPLLWWLRTPPKDENY